MIWRAVAWLQGWRRAYDYEQCQQVVWHGGNGWHYTGRDAWRDAALHRWRS